MSIETKCIGESLKGSKLPRLAKLFASSEYKYRNKAFKIVTKVLSTANSVGINEKQISWNELIAVCKGLHYWLWMQDKMILHEEVVEKMCTLIGIIFVKNVRDQFIKCMFETEDREWDTLDVHRKDKFMMFIRDFFSACLTNLKANNWASLSDFLVVIKTYLVNTNLTRSVSLKMHFADILLGELTKAEVPSEILDRFIHPFCEVLEILPTDHVYSKRIRKMVFDALLNMHVTDPTSVNVSVIGARLFNIGKSKNIRAANRKVLYAMARRFGLSDEVLTAPSDEPMDSDSQNQINGASPKESADNSEAEAVLSTPSNNKTPSPKNKKTKTSSNVSEISSPISQLTPLPNSNSKKRKRSSTSPLNTPSTIEATVTTPKTSSSPSTKSPKDKTPSPSISKKRKRDSASPTKSSTVVNQAVLTPKTNLNAAVAKTPKSTNDSMMCDDLNDSDLMLKKRVSFGKIFRKPFRKKDTVLTPSPNSLQITKIPDKGILKPKRLSFVSSSAQKLSERVLRNGHGKAFRRSLN